MTEWTFKGLHITYFSVTALQKRSFSLTMSMTIFRSDCLCFLVKFWKMSQFSSCRSLKPTARWWFSNTDESLYISASSESAQETWLIILACGNGSFSHFKYRTWNSKVCHDSCNLKVELFKTFSRWIYSFFLTNWLFLIQALRVSMRVCGIRTMCRRAGNVSCLNKLTELNEAGQ